MNQILRFPSVRADIGCSRTTIHRRIHAGVFPRPVNLGAKAVGWPSHEVEVIKAAWTAGASDEEVRALVQRLHEERAKGGIQTVEQGLSLIPRLRAAREKEQPIAASPTLHAVARKGEEARG